MSSTTQPIRVRKAPAESGGRWFELSSGDSGPLAAVVERNRERRQPSIKAACTTRVELMQLAEQFTRRSLTASDANSPDSSEANRLDGPLIVTGHQPEWFHPGVWLKNFAAAGLARQMNGAALNLIVDNDAVDRGGVTWPERSDDGRWRIVHPLWIDGAGTQPWEATVGRITQNPFLPGSFHDWPWRPIASQFPVNQVVTSVLATASIRHAYERKWGGGCWELPVSWLADSTSFCEFAEELLQECDRFHAAYHTALTEYRTAYGVRGRARPWPDLQRASDWFEAPFWVWRSGTETRDRLWVRPAGGRGDSSGGWLLGVGVGRTTPVRVSAGRIVSEAWDELRAAGYVVRPRAVTLTLFVRSRLADLFLHGLGGGLYDRVTDRLHERFYGGPASVFAVTTGTLRLPLERPETHDSPQIGDWRQRLWRLKHHADQFLSPSNEVTTTTRRLRELLDALESTQGVSRRETAVRLRRAGWYRELRRLRAELAVKASGLVEAAEHELAAAVRSETDRAVERGREWSWPAYPEESLREFLKPALSDPTA